MAKKINHRGRGARRVAVFCRVGDDYQVYMTNIPVESRSAEGIAILCGARWGIEMASEGIEELLPHGPDKH